MQYRAMTLSSFHGLHYLNFIHNTFATCGVGRSLVGFDSFCNIYYLPLYQMSLPWYSFHAIIDAVITYYLLTESEVITGKSQTEALMY